MTVLAALLIVALVVQQYWHISERRELLNRIQAPELAIKEQMPAESKLEGYKIDPGPWEIPEEAIEEMKNGA